MRKFCLSRNGINNNNQILGKVGQPNLPGLVPVMQTVCNLFITAVLAAILAGCMVDPVRHNAVSPPQGAFEEAFKMTGQELIAELRRLQSRLPTQGRLDLQTAITLEALRIQPRYIADRRLFYQEADKLKRMLALQPYANIPRDSAVLAYLANMAGKKNSSQSFLSEEEEGEVLRLCGPSHTTIATEITLNQKPEIGMLRQACFIWLLGDASKSRAIFYYLRSTPSIAAMEINASLGTSTGNAFDSFIFQLHRKTGVDLLAHRDRLAGTGHKGSSVAKIQKKWGENLSKINSANGP